MSLPDTGYMKMPDINNIPDWLKSRDIPSGATFRPEMTVVAGPAPQSAARSGARPGDLRLIVMGNSSGVLN